MKKKPITDDRQKKEIRGYINKWRNMLFLQQWEFSVVYHNDVDDKGVLIVMRPEYKDAIISINADDFFGREKNSREEVIVHELCHCVLQPMVHLVCEAAKGRQVSQEEIDWFKEEVTQHFARAIYYK